MLSFLSTVALKIFLPLSLVKLAHKFESVGLMSILSLSESFKVILGILILDAAIYWQHRFSHAWTPLWNLHRVHHSDIDFDATTAIRFHPLEIMLSYLFKALLIMLFGLSAVTVVVFEVILNFSAMFNHGNFSFSEKTEVIVRKFIVTPDMHRIHHSVDMKEANSNYAFFLSLWDKIFGSYCAAPDSNPKNMPLGLSVFREDTEQGLLRLLTQPWRTYFKVKM